MLHGFGINIIGIVVIGLENHVGVERIDFDFAFGGKFGGDGDENDRLQGVF